MQIGSTVGVKTCSHCKQPKPLDQFSKKGDKRNLLRVHSWCKKCKKVREYAWLAKPENKHGNRARRYGISKSDYEQMRQSQGGACAICKATPEILAIDHDHTSGAVRGLLCSSCNSGLGFFKDDPSKLRAAISYLAR